MKSSMGSSLLTLLDQFVEGRVLMDDQKFDALINKNQNEVSTETENVLGEKSVDYRWRNFMSCGVMEGADGHARLKGSCGDTMEMYILVADDRIKLVSYVTDGCISSSTAGSFTAELAKGKTFAEILDMTKADVLHEIGPFPEAEEHCAHLAVTTLQEAVNSYMVEQVKGAKQSL
jgi:nitrogen fixation protein NifU and related proteins